MQAVNAEMNPQQMSQTMRAFAMEMEKANIIGEDMVDTFSILEDPTVQADSEDVY